MLVSFLVEERNIAEVIYWVKMKEYNVTNRNESGEKQKVRVVGIGMRY